MRRLTVLRLGVSVALAVASVWVVTAPDRLDSSAVAGFVGDASRGEAVFWAGGCASCHMAEGAEGPAQLVLSGGQRFQSDFGTFVAPNISPHPTKGIGGWSLLDLANAMTRGVSPEGAHYYPAFPYTSYVRADLRDIADLKAFLDKLPVSDAASLPHDVGFPFNIRRALGGWKMLFFRSDWVVHGDLGEVETRGRYLAEALGHCGECHTPRNALGGPDLARWLGGAPNPTGKGRIPNITPGVLDWSEADLVGYFTTGFTPDFDSAGGHMAHVVENLARLPESDRAAIAAYLKVVRPLP